jgi:hypothetical protein
MGRKRSKISKTNGFQKGNKPWNKGIDLEFDNNLKIEKCKRLEHNVYNSYVHENLNGVLSIHNVDGSHVLLAAQSNFRSPRHSLLCNLWFFISDTYIDSTLALIYTLFV